MLALDSGDPVSIASSGANLLGVLGVLPYGQVIGLVISLLDMAFSEPPVIEGQASMGWNDQGELKAQVDSSSHGGGALAQAQAEGLGVGMETGLQTRQDEQGIPPEAQVTLNPDNMPVVGYHSQYETVRMLSWTDQDGNTHTRYYDANGQHPSGSSMAQDYVQMVGTCAANQPIWALLA